MMKLEEIILNWKEDCQVDSASPEQELIKTPLLHAKYIEILSQHRLSSHKMKFNHAKMKKIRREYYLGNLDKDTLDEYDWEQFEVIIGTKGNMEYYLDSDDNLIKLLEKKAYYDECVSICESIIKELNSRTWQLREFCVHTRFLAGG